VKQKDGNVSRSFIRIAFVLIGCVLACRLASAQGRTELGVADSFVVQGTSGTKADPDVKLAGYTLFGTNAAGALSVTSGAGNVYIQNSLEVGSNLYLHGGGLVFPDATTQTTAYTAGNITGPLLSGECDTNRLDILVSTNYIITGIKVLQTPVVPQMIEIYVNGTAVDAFALSTNTVARSLSFSLAAFDRLGIACTNLNGTVLFSFEGRRQ
jgi:hypothetical protein